MSDIDTVVMDSLKVLDPKWPIEKRTLRINAIQVRYEFAAQRKAGQALLSTPGVNAPRTWASGRDIE